MTFALELRGIHKRFGRLVALEDASLAVRAGTVHALLGENGAGKTTLMRVAFGMVSPDAGEVVVRGTTHRWRTAADALAGGIGMVHQHFTLVGAMTVAENVSLGMRGPFRPAAAAARVRALAERTGLSIDPGVRIRDLPVGAQQRAEILKAVARDVHVLILDEPTAVLAPPEISGLLSWMRRFVADGPRAIVLITHKLREAAQVADDVTVVRRGKSVFAAAAHDAPEPALVRAMLGDQAPGTPRDREPPPVPRDEVVLSLHEVVVRSRDGRLLLQPTTAEVRAGEVVGVAAVEGAGQDVLLRLLAGRLHPTTGEARIPDDVAFIPEDRLRDAAVADFTLTENVALRDLAGARRLSWEVMRARARAVMERFDVRAADPDDRFRALSGGNQQRFVLGRELDPLPRALVAVNPTRGLDVRATRDVMARLRTAARAGVAVVVHSTDLDEVLAIADRTWVVHAGRVWEVPPERDTIGRAMVGAA